jgi:D-beta-D-heptose 7-phosphate kinase/D-beta-D-heptose 1-phosphate adenosyltransferase
MSTICVSGGFDPLHVGHIKMIRAAKNFVSGSLNPRLVVILNSDSWLMRKKGYIFMPFDERKEILLSNRNVNGVAWVNDEDNTVCEALQRIMPDYFANGGDRTDENTPEMDLCLKYGIGLVFNIGGGKVQSSSKLVASSLGADIPSSDGVEDG